jgi:hypothetical protein
MKTKLNVHARNVTSQHGEDGILEYIVSCLGTKAIPVVCEFGAWDGIVASNAYNLWHNKNWQGILIEGDVARFSELKKNTEDKSVTVLSRMLAVHGPDSLDELFKANRIKPEIGILSIDIDSYDYHVWKHIRYVDPQVVVIEQNQHIPPHIEYFDPEGQVYLKCSAKALEKLGAEKGYKLICCTRVNSIFVKQNLFDPEKFPDMPVEWLFDYSELKPQVIFTGEGGNMYPVFSKKASRGMKLWWRIYYRLSSLHKTKRTFRKPPADVLRQIRDMGLDA